MTQKNPEVFTEQEKNIIQTNLNNIIMFKAENLTIKTIYDKNNYNKITRFANFPIYDQYRNLVFEFQFFITSQLPQNLFNDEIVDKETLQYQFRILKYKNNSVILDVQTNDFIINPIFEALTNSFNLWYKISFDKIITEKNNLVKYNKFSQDQLARNIDILVNQNLI